MQRRNFLATLGLFALQRDAFAQRGDDAKARSTLIDLLLARYAAGVPADQQTRYDKAVAATLDEIPGAREHVRKRFPPATLAKLPAFAPDRLPLLKNLRGRLDDDAPSPPLKRVNLAPPSQVRLHIEGFHCFTSTDGPGADEAYLCFVIVTPKSGPPGKRWKVQSAHYPNYKSSVAVNDGDTIQGPRGLIYDGPARDMVVMAVLLEHDWGTPGAVESWIKAAANTVLAVLQENDPDATLDDVAAGLALEAQRMPDGTGYYDSDANALASDDDILQAKVRVFKKLDLQQMAVHPPHTTESLEGKEYPARMPYHFRTRHKGDGAHYLCYYKVEPS